MNLKIGIQNLHPDEIITLHDLFYEEGIKIYSWHANHYDKQELLSCDLLVLFARRHWEYLKFKKPYLLILADYVSNEKAINLSMSRQLTLTGYRYKQNSFFTGYVCGSSELKELIEAEKIPCVFYPKKYPFSEFFKANLSTIPDQPRDIVTLINNYERTARELKWSKPENSYRVFKAIEKAVPEFRFIHYGVPHNLLSFEDSKMVQLKARYTIHIKYWGHVCNAVVKSLALGTPVIMDEATFMKGRYKSYVRHGQNSMIFKNKEEIIDFLTGKSEDLTWQHLKRTCIDEAYRWHFPYTQEEKSGWRKLIKGLT